jgi:hypothetical protein
MGKGNGMYNIEYELRKCKECSCSRCLLNGTDGCYIEIAIKELGRYEQAMDALGMPITDNQVSWDEMDHVK